MKTLWISIFLLFGINFHDVEGACGTSTIPNIAQLPINDVHKCNIDLINFPKNPVFEQIEYYPCVYVKDGQFIYPDDSVTNRTLRGCIDSIKIWCPERGRTFLDEWICVDDNFFYNEALRDTEDFGIFNSTKWARGVEKPVMQNCLNDANSRVIQIGIDVPTSLTENIFHPLYSSCYNVLNARVNYVKFTVKPFQHQTIDHITFVNSVLNENINVESFYNVASQLVTLRNILGAEKASHLVYNATDRIDFLSRGHLAAKTDFVYAHQQSSTFFHSNVVPQWQSFNQGAWFKLEQYIRKTSFDTRSDIDVITGTMGTLTMKNEYGNWVELFLGPNNRIPVPMYFFKILPKRHVVYIGKNFIQRDDGRIHEWMPIVQDICTRLNEPNPVLNNNFVYACSREEFLYLYPEYRNI